MRRRMFKVRMKRGRPVAPPTRSAALLRTAQDDAAWVALNHRTNMRLEQSVKLRFF